MDWKSIAGNVARIAPGIGAAIGGPAGSVVGLGVKALCDAFGVDSGAPDATQQVEQALNSMTPEQAVELKKADNQFILDMKELDIKVFELEVEDRDSARKREIDVGSRETAILAYIIVLAFVFVIGFILQALLHDNKNIESIGVLGGSLIGSIITLLAQKVEQVCGYFFGSSKGSQAKTNTMSANITKALDARSK